MPPSFAAAIDALDKALRGSHNLQTWLRGRRWLGDALGPRSELAVKDRVVLAESATEALVLFLVVAKEENVFVPMHIPLSVSTARFDADAFELPVGGDRVYVMEAERRDSYAQFVLDGFHERQTVATLAGDTLSFRGDDLGAFRSMAPATDDSSNLLMRIDTTRGPIVFKSYKLLDTHNLEPDILERLRKKEFRHAPRFLGEMDLGKGDDRLVVGVATNHVESTDAFAWLTAAWGAELGGNAPQDFEEGSLEFVRALGGATAALHEALLDRHPGPFQVETFTAEDSEAGRRVGVTNLSDSLRRLAVLAKGPDERAADLAAKARTMVFEERESIEAALAGIDACVGTAKSVTHADLHLGQVLRTPSGDLLFIDFEGEPERAPGQRSVKLPPLRDVATMRRSFAYVRHYAWREATKGDATAALRLLQPEARSRDEEDVAHRLAAWETAAVERFTREYLAHATPYESLGSDDAHRAIRGWAMEKALYEFRYELKHRPANIFIPLEGILSLASMK